MFSVGQEQGRVTGRAAASPKVDRAALGCNGNDGQRRGASGTADWPRLLRNKNRAGPRAACRPIRTRRSERARLTVGPTIYTTITIHRVM